MSLGKLAIAFAVLSCVILHGLVFSMTGTAATADIDECTARTHECGLRVNCTNTVGSYICTCPLGYNWSSDFRTCEDFDECKDSRCKLNEACTNTKGSYFCSCREGYTGKHCQTEINECASTPCQNGATCNDRISVYNCSCPPGYMGTNCVTEINECASTPCQNGATCNDRISVYNCSCPPGYTGINCATEINECASTPCQNGATCNDRISVYNCSCPPGYMGINCATAQSKSSKGGSSAAAIGGAIFCGVAICVLVIGVVLAYLRKENGHIPLFCCIVKTPTVPSQESFYLEPLDADSTQPTGEEATTNIIYEVATASTPSRLCKMDSSADSSKDEWKAVHTREEIIDDNGYMVPVYPVPSWIAEPGGEIENCDSSMALSLHTREEIIDDNGYMVPTYPVPSWSAELGSKTVNSQSSMPLPMNGLEWSTMAEDRYYTNNSRSIASEDNIYKENSGTAQPIAENNMHIYDRIDELQSCVMDPPIILKEGGKPASVVESVEEDYVKTTPLAN